jgi:transposase
MKEKSPMRAITIGVDLAKQTFSTCEVDASGRVVRRKDFGREGFAAWLAQVPAGAVVAMEACGSAHHWARRCLEYGAVPKLMAAPKVVPFRKSRTTKNDRNDAEAIATAARQGNMCFVPVKSVDQQARLSCHRVREGYKVQALAIANRMRGLLAEFGIAVAHSNAALRRVLGDSAVRSKLPAPMPELLDELKQQWLEVSKLLAGCEARIARHARADDRCVRSQRIIGVGSLTADAVVATVGTAKEFRNGRQFAAWVGLTPMQYSTGGRTRLGPISCRGDTYLRTLLIQGARSSLRLAQAVAPERATPEQIWIQQLADRLPFGKLVVAIANKHARQLWAILAHGEDYDPHAWMKHPMVQRAAVHPRAAAA